MKELSFHILDIAKNSTAAGAKTVTITVEADTARDSLVIKIADDGRGMSPELLARVTDPFTTTRTTRPVGLGIPLFKDACEATGGALSIESELGVGTTTTARFGFSSIDRMPLGDVGGALTVLIQGNPKLRFIFRASKNGEEFSLDTDELHEVLGDVPLDEPSVLVWIGENIAEGLDEIGLAND